MKSTLRVYNQLVTIQNLQLLWLF